ncbi:SixA phosphatase family protein [Streptomyces sp. S186]|uniref:SixA phosphatase family protein n=1 Tax=Streptomyces sp. S186 TaxID=3434395 RepID=UPI003F66AD02
MSAAESASTSASEGGCTRLIVLRHAKSAWREGVPDHERPLAGRGRRDAPAVGRWLRQRHCTPDLVVCSTSRRTRETWERVSAELLTTAELPTSQAAPAGPDVIFEPRVYAASADTLLQVVRALPDRCRTALVIGHQPAVQDLVVALAGSGDADSLARVRGKFATSAVAVLTVPDGWARLEAGGAVLTAFAVPRGAAHDAH